MQIQTHDADLYVDNSLMRVYVASPKPEGKYPGILLYSEIFQLTGPILRSANRLAGHGFVVAAPEIYHRHEPIGTVIAYDDLGRMRGNDGAKRTVVSAFDADAKATLDYLAQHPQVAPTQLGTMGFCIGGHLAMRGALDPRVKASVCCYPTGVHNGKLGKDADAGTLQRFNELRAELLVVFGSIDPHVPAVGRQIVAEALKKSNVRHKILELPGEHAFMRDEGVRYDPAAADTVYTEAISLFRRAFA
jgi:carboxymethylenebutenolidase